MDEAQYLTQLLIETAHRLVAHLQPPAPDRRLDQALGLLTHLNAKVTTMADQLSTDLAALSDAVGQIKTAVAAQLVAIQALKDKIAAGGAVTAEELATLESNTAALQAVTASMAPEAPPAG